VNVSRNVSLLGLYGYARLEKKSDAAELGSCPVLIDGEIEGLSPPLLTIWRGFSGTTECGPAKTYDASILCRMGPMSRYA